MDNQHRQIKGYRELNSRDIALMSRIKEKGAELEGLISTLRSQTEADPRWLGIGDTHLQQSLMARTRAVVKPTFF